VTKKLRLLFIEGVDAPTFRLFQLSILWRASVSRLPFFERVSLGKHEERVRNLLLKGDPGDWAQYGCLMYGLRTPDASPTGIIIQPTRDRQFGHTAYRFVFGGFGWIYLVSSHTAPPPLAAGFLKENGRLVISLVDLYASEWMANFAMERAKREQWRHAL
jgi:hypothetical protein